jgi:hypothetical protein
VFICFFNRDYQIGTILLTNDNSIESISLKEETSNEIGLKAIFESLNKSINERGLFFEKELR